VEDGVIGEYTNDSPVHPRAPRTPPCATLHPRCTCRGDSRPCVRRALCTRTTAWRSSSPCASRRPWRVPSRLTPNPPPLHRLLVVRQPRSLALNVYTMCRAGAEAPRTNGRHLLSASVRKRQNRMATSCSAAGWLRGMAPTTSCSAVRPSFAYSALARRPASSVSKPGQPRAMPQPRLSARAATASGWGLRPLTQTHVGPMSLGMRCRGLVRARAGYGEAHPCPCPAACSDTQVPKSCV
jgi:hypothetical protein